MTVQWVRYSDAALDVGLPVETIRTWGKRGVIDKVMIGGLIHVDLAMVRRAERDVRVSGKRPGRRRKAEMGA